MESSWHILGQLSVNCPFCAEALCGLCFPAPRCSHATKTQLKGNIQMRPETEILFFSIRGWSLLIMVQLHWQQKTCNAVSCVGDDTWIRRCLRPSSSRLALPLHAAVREKKCAWTQANSKHTCSTCFYPCMYCCCVCSQTRVPAHACSCAM